MRVLARAGFSFAAFVFCLSGPAARGATVLWSPGNLDTRAIGSGGDVNAPTLRPDTLPFVAPQSAVSGGTSSTSGIVLLESGFTINGDQVLEPGVDSTTTYSTGTIWFKVTEDTPYSVSGLYNGASGAHGDTLDLIVRLSKYGSDTLFYSKQQSNAAVNESFVVGSSYLGNSSNTLLTGDQAGMLIAEQRYVFSYTMGLREGYNSDGGSASGYVRLDIGTVIPEPGGLSLALASLLLGARRRRSSP